ncbi:MAG: restriction endonuclease subunit S, partial [Clostridium sp.]|nr:restriction endonuclease subunit S [Clostridium sp.]
PNFELEIQDKIVQVLDKAQELIDKRKAQIEALDELVKSRFIEMFGNVNTNSKNWDLVSMYKLIDVVGGYAFKSTDFVEEGIPVLKIGNINAGYFKSTNLMFWKRDNRLNKYLIKPGDLVISLTGTVGKNDYGNVCIMGNDYNEYYLNQRNAKLEILSNNSLNKYYLTYILKVPEIKKRLTGISRGVRQANIANKDILNLEVPIPPINLQNQFADFVQQVDKLKLQIQESLKELEDNFNSLMQRAFKGELFN